VKSIAATQSTVLIPDAVPIFTARMFAAGATPGPSLTTPFEVMIPVTCVPCPTSSSAAPGPERRVPPPGQPPPDRNHSWPTMLLARSGWSVSTS
jgi:hypothetical protein